MGKVLIRAMAILLLAYSVLIVYKGVRVLSLARSSPLASDDNVRFAWTAFSALAFGLAALRITAGTLNIRYRCHALGLVAIASLLLDLKIWHTYWTALPLLVCALAIYLSPQGKSVFSQNRSSWEYHLTSAVLGTGAFLLLVSGTMVFLKLVNWPMPLPRSAEKPFFGFFIFAPALHVPACLRQPAMLSLTPLGAILVYHCPGVLLLVLAALSELRGSRLAGASVANEDKHDLHHDRR